MQSKWTVLALFALVFGTQAHADKKVVVEVNLNPAGNFTAETSKITGYAYKTQDGIAAENVKVDMRSLKTGIGLRDEHTKKRLQTTKYPFAKLIKATGKNGRGKALVEIKGVKKEVNGTYKVVGNEVQAEFPIRLTDLKIEDINYMGVGVEEEVKLRINLPLQQRAPASAGQARKSKK